MGSILDLAAQAVHSDGEGVVINEVAVLVPQLFQQKAAGDHRPRAAGEDPEQLILVGGDGQHLPAPDGSEGGEVQAEETVVVPLPVPFVLGGAPAEGHLHPFFQDGQAEGLGDVVVRPQVKPFQHVLLQVVGGEEEDGEVGVLLLHLPAQVEAAAVGEVHVKESQVEGLLLQQLPGLLAVVGRYGQVAAGVQFKTEPGTEGQVIFQHQDVCHGGTSLGVLSYGGIISRFW